MVSQQLEVVAKRRFRATRERIFQAFTTPSDLSRWFSPSAEIQIEILDFELKVGGHYRFRYHSPGQPVSSVIGEYREISAPSRLVFSWTWEPPDPHAGIETLVTVELESHDDQTEVVVTHQQFPDQQTRDRHNEGWQNTLERLSQMLKVATNPAQ